MALQQFTLNPVATQTIALSVAIALGLSSCTPPPTAESEVNSEELQVVTTFLPITQFTRAVVGDRAEVVQLLPSNVSPHDYQAKPTHIQAIAGADVLVQNGLEFEFFLDDLVANADNDDLVIINSSDDIKTIAFSESEEKHGEEKQDAHAGHDDHGEGEEHGHEEHNQNAEEHNDHDDHGAGDKPNAHAGHDEHDAEKQDDDDEHDKAEAGHHHHHHHHHGTVDPHIWLDPKRAIEQVTNIRDGLIAADPAGAADYTANAAAYIEQLQVLDQDITQQLDSHHGQTFISFHDFAAYFADSYGLEAEFLVDVPAENPTPEDVKRVIQTTRAEKLSALLTEPQGEAAFEALAQDLGVGVAVFDPLETGALDEPDGYLSVMRQNLQSLKKALTSQN